MKLFNHSIDKKILMLPFDTLSWIILIGCALAIGFNKTSGLGVAIIFVPLVAGIMPARQSVGLILPMLCISDIIALSYWRRHIQWRLLLRLMPWVFGGVALGYSVLKNINDQLLMLVIGVVILVMISLTAWRNSRYGRSRPIPTYWWFAAVMGVMTGATSTLANAAGPIMVIYLLAMRLEKGAFIGTHLGCFWILNLTKVPLYLHEELITKTSFLTDLAMIPALLVGGVLGIVLVQRLNQKAFNAIVSFLAAAAAVHLCLKAFI